MEENPMNRRWSKEGQFADYDRHEALQAAQDRVIATAKEMTRVHKQALGGDLNIKPLIDAQEAQNKAVEVLLELESPTPCDHEWTDARNEVVESGEICLKCMTIRAGNQATGGQS